MLPTGTLTFLMTDVQGSTRLSRELGSGYDRLNEAHQAIVRRAVSGRGGIEVSTAGDSFFVVFEDAGGAVRAAADIQRAIAAHAWPDDAPMAVRIGLHTGTAHLAGDDYGGYEVSRAARIANAGSGGQILASEPVRALVAGDLPRDVAFRDLGRFRLKDIAEPEHLFQLDVDGLVTDFPPLRGTVTGIGNLPLRMTSFVGRNGYLARLQDLLAAGRLVTLTGPGGAGKTSLAVELARRVATAFPDGAWLIDLAAVRDAKDVRATVARTLGLHDGPTGPAADRLDAHLADRSALLVLDNFEQVVGAAGDVRGMLEHSPLVKIVVSSRVPLRVAGEQEVPVGPLAIDGADSEAEGALRLFLDRARAARPHFDPGPSEMAAIGEIGSLLDGLPLGIELAAARVATIPVTAIRDRLKARLPLPGSGPRDLPARQRTLEDAIAWSYDLLDAPVRRLFDRTGVFAGSFDLAQAEEVCGSTQELGVEVLDGLVQLTEHSLLGSAQGDGDTGIRYRALETVRTAALARLRASGDDRPCRTRHLTAYAALASRAAPQLPGADQARWLDRLAADDANLRAAIHWAIEIGEAETALLMVANLWRYWLISGRLNQGREMINGVVSMPGATDPSPARIRALDAVGGASYWNGDVRGAEEAYREQLRLAQGLGLRWEEANAQYNLAHAGFAYGDLTASEDAFREAVRLFEEEHDERMLARLRWGNVTLEQRMGRPIDAIAAHTALLREFEANGDTWYQGMALGSIAASKILMGDPVGAIPMAVQALKLQHALRDLADLTLGLQWGAIVAVQTGRPRQAAILMGAFDTMCTLEGMRPPAGFEALIGKLGRPEIAALQTLGKEAYEAAFAEGARMTADEAVEFMIAIAREITGEG